MSHSDYDIVKCYENASHIINTPRTHIHIHTYTLTRIDTDSLASAAAAAVAAADLQMKSVEVCPVASIYHLLG